MTQHTDLIDRLIGLAETAHSYYEGSSFDAVAKAAFKDALSDALEAQAREIAELKAQLAATAKNAFEAMPHDIPLRMKREICVSAAWSGSMVSRMYTELRKAFTGEPYKANEDLDAALLEIEVLRNDAALVAARERERCANLVLTTDAWRNAGWVSTICPTTKHAIAAAIRAINTEGEVLDATTAQKGGE